MAVFLPTKNNVRFLKSILMDAFEMRSSHATEAIAALIGYRSNASFLASSNHLTDTTVFEVFFDEFEARCAHLGYHRSSSEYLRFIFRGIDWPDAVWKTFKRRDRTAINAWFYECQERSIPFIYIDKARKYCAVHWDHITLDSQYDETVRQNAGGELHRVLFRTYQLIVAGEEPKSFFEGSAFVGDVTGLSEASARQIANAFARLLFPGNVQAAMAA